LNKRMTRTWLAALGLVVLCSSILATSPAFDSDCCEDSFCVDCVCIQCLMYFNNIIEPCAITFDVPQKTCQSLFVYQASLDLLEPTFEIDQPPKPLI